MNKHLYSRYLIIVLSIFIISSCKSGKGLIGKKDPNRATREMLTNISAERVQYETISINGRANIDASKQGLKIGVSYRMSMYADSLIWLRISKFGLEGMRALVTKDSIFVIDRTNNQVHISDFSLAEEYTGLKADLGILQDLFLGNLNVIPGINNMQANGKEGDLTTVTGAKAGTQFNYKVDDQLKKLIVMEAINVAQKLHSQTTYSDFESYGNTQMPQATKIQVIAPDEMTLDFKHRKVEVNPAKISFKFSIPESYERVVYD